MLKHALSWFSRVGSLLTPLDAGRRYQWTGWMNGRKKRLERSIFNKGWARENAVFEEASVQLRNGVDANRHGQALRYSNLLAF